MKKFKMIRVMVFAMCLLLMLSNCSYVFASDSSEELIGAGNEAADAVILQTDFSTIDVEIELDDLDGMKQLIDEMGTGSRNGQIIKVTGRTDTRKVFMSCSIMEKVDGVGYGTNYYIYGYKFYADYPQSGEIVTLTGVVIEDGWNHYLYCLPENVHVGGEEEETETESSDTDSELLTESMDETETTSIETEVVETEAIAETEIMKETEEVVEEVEEAGTVLDFTCYGKEYSLPFAAAELEDEGWSWQQSSGDTIIPAAGDSNLPSMKREKDKCLLMIRNVSDTDAEAKACEVYSVKFTNPGNGTENITFIGGITYSSTEEEVRSIMADLGYTNCKEYPGSAPSIVYFLDDENNSLYNISFAFYNGEIFTVLLQCPRR